MPNVTAPTYRSGAQSVPASDAAATLEERAIALAFLQKLATEVSKGTVDLPCFPDVVIRISHALADPNTTSDKVVTIVGAEPRLAARVLQTANSAAFNSSGKPLTDLRSAITRLGQQMVQSTAMSYAMQHMKNEASLRSIAQPLTELWNKSIAVASICKLVAARTKVSGGRGFLDRPASRHRQALHHGARGKRSQRTRQRAIMDGTHQRLAGLDRQGGTAKLGLRRRNVRSSGRSRRHRSPLET